MKRKKKTKWILPFKPQLEKKRDILDRPSLNKGKCEFMRTCQIFTLGHNGKRSPARLAGIFFSTICWKDRLIPFLGTAEKCIKLWFIPSIQWREFLGKVPDTMDQVQLQPKQTEFPLKSMGVAPADFGVEYGPICGYYKGSVSKVSSGLFYGNADLAPGTSEDQ